MTAVLAGLLAFAVTTLAVAVNADSLWLTILATVIGGTAIGVYTALDRRYP